MKVYLIEPIHQEAYDYLSQNCEIVDDLSICDGLITRNIKVNGALMDKAPHLKVIGVHGTGYDDVDLEEANKRNIIVYNVPNQNSLSVAELNIALMLSLSRKMVEANQSKELAPISLMGNELSYKTVGFIGLGNIAQITAKMLHFGFSMRVLAYTRHIKGIDYIEECELKKVLNESDYVIVGLSLNKETEGYINLELLKEMKSSAYLINTARGAIVNEQDLIEALKKHMIQGYGADVFINEPEINPELNCLNVVHTPHIGATTQEALKRVGMLTVINMVKALNKEKIENQIGGK